MKSILVSIVPEETCMAVVSGQELLALQVERPSHSHLVGNIYKGYVQNVLPGMQAAFVDIGQSKNAFMYIGDGMPKDVIEAIPANEKIHIGQKIPVQIVKDAVGTKGPRATTHLSLPGRHVVLMPTAAYIGISRRIEDDEERDRLHKIAEKLCPKGMGLIIRTVAAGQKEEVLAKDVNYLTRLWESLMARNRMTKVPTLLYRDADLIIRIVRDYFTDEISELVLDDLEMYQRVTDLVSGISPELLDRVKLYDGKTPMFKKYGIDKEIEKVGSRQIELPSGGFIVIDKTEALTVIDVNTGKYVGRNNLSDTAYNANIEAAEEILKQIRLRDIGGIIIIDFIDMDTGAQKEGLMEYMRDRVKLDRTKTNIVDITSLGLVEITRKKSRQNFESIIYTECPCCNGKGRIESPETVVISICRELRRFEAKQHASGGYTVEVHPTVEEALIKSENVKQLSRTLGIDIHICSDPAKHPEAYSILQKS